MPTPLENELGLGPVVHRVRRWFRNLIARLGGDAFQLERRSLDPLTVNYVAWDEVRHSAREWPHYKEAPNSLEVLVSPEDWEEYWGIDTARKEQGVAAYVRARAAERGYWMSGDPQVLVMADDDVEIGDVVVECQFAEPTDGEDFSPLGHTTTQRIDAREEAAFASAKGPAQGKKHGATPAATPTDDPIPADVTTIRPRPKSTGKSGAKPGPKAATSNGTKPPRKPAGSPNDNPGEAQVPTPPSPPTMRMIDPETSPNAILTDDNGFRLTVKSGDCIGAIQEGEEVPEEVNIRLDAKGFPYVDVKQCELSIIDGRWMVTNHSYHGTKLVTKDGRRLMLGEPEPYPIIEGDVLFLGPERPLRFELA